MIRTAGAVLVSLALTTGVARATPIPNGIAILPPPTYLGHAAKAHRIRHVPRTPRNRFMARNGRSEIHDDAWQTDTYRWSGPLGRTPAVFSSYLPPGHDCGSITFDRRGRVVSICVGLTGPQLYMFDPANLDVLATFPLPPRQTLPTTLFRSSPAVATSISTTTTA
jgi:hypothetical protein